MNDDAKNDRASWLQGPSAKCSHPPDDPHRPWRFVLLGAPGVGKGTQAAMFCKHFAGCHLSTGDLFRAAASSCNGHPTPAMTEAIGHMREGKLVPDLTVCRIVAERSGCLRCRGGFVLDGFPRTVAQAQTLDKQLRDEGLRLDAVVNYELPTDEIVSRISGRRVCAKCKSVFHETGNPPRVQGICDQCGGPLSQREDDRPESVRVRLDAYHRETFALVRFYKDLGLLLPVAASGTPEQVFTRALTALEVAIADGFLRSRNPQDAIVGVSGADYRCRNEPL